MCGSSEITMHLSNRLELIVIKISDIDYMVTLKECTMDLQEHSAGAKTAFSILKFLKHRSASAPRNPLGKNDKKRMGQMEFT